ncbi:MULTISPECIES: HdeD family acid-resistance protein [unclassified Leifsonia]|uniref:HdeD family acid-resistance protein n=1 Tax=unclassified Leifsonia TaxID=2663824 RepID=UPI0006FE0C34|nr:MULTISPECIES: DUF308 domain-containing protein [unclassified Leifsonia]KQX08006.1 hypothetical protein ASC59_09955 [Leifsonia sp. Root1293]KRA12287.1 hypothetical protein ASD61_09955 [Leifsonia sp. Root60]
MSQESGAALSVFSLDSAALSRTAVNSIRAALGIGGAVALIVGLLITFQPEAAATTIAVLLGVYFVIAGVVYVVVGITARGLSGAARALDACLGVLFLVGAGLAFANLSGTVAFLAGFLGIVIGVLWIVEGIATLVQLSDAPSKGWAVVIAIVSILAGIALLFAPVWGARLLFLVTGVALIVLGIMQIVRAFTFGRRGSGQTGVEA